jgi:hypothetical protein
MTEHLSEEDLVLIYYNEPGPTRAMRVHLDECGQCHDAAEALARVLNSCSEWQIPEPSPQLARRIKALIPARVVPIRGWVGVAAAIAAVLLLTFFAGRYSQRPHPFVFAGLSPQAQHRILAISLADHLDRAERLLTEISNASDDEPVDRARAQDLVDEGQLMRQSLAREGDSSTLAFLDDVERFMLEVANAPDQADPEQLRQLRERIASDSLLFKVRIIESNLRTQGQRS